MRGCSASLHGLPERVDVLGDGAGQAGDDAALDLAGDLLDGREVVRGGGREASLDDVHVQPRELLGDLELLLGRQREAGRLLPIAQRGVEDPYVCHGHLRGSGCWVLGARGRDGHSREPRT